MMPTSIIILLAVLVLISVRKLINIPIPIWAIMLGGALLTIFFKQITLYQAFHAIDLNIILYLFGVFIICQAAEDSGYLEHLTNRLFSIADTGKEALKIIVFILGLSSALLMNDTIAIVGTSIILQLSKTHKNLTKPLLLALAYAITISSLITPVGNPQNLLIAMKGEILSPFMAFIKTFIIPTAINLVITYFLIYFIFKKELNEKIEQPKASTTQDFHTSLLVKISLTLMLLLIFTKVILEQYKIYLNFFYIALLPALVILFLSKKKKKHLQKMDWGTLIFFISMFILMKSVSDSHFFQDYIYKWQTITNIPMILLLSITLSQFISNVPLVALYLPLLIHNDTQQTHLLALAAGSTIAGNLSLLGAASNIIILQNAEKRGSMGFSFLEFSKIGIPLTIVNSLVYLIFI